MEFQSHIVVKKLRYLTPSSFVYNRKMPNLVKIIFPLTFMHNKIYYTTWTSVYFVPLTVMKGQKVFLTFAKGWNLI